jgi:hypothetical protein
VAAPDTASDPAAGNHLAEEGNHPGADRDPARSPGEEDKARAAPAEEGSTARCKEESQLARDLVGA